MPYTIVGENYSPLRSYDFGRPIKYDYPYGLDLKPGSELHANIVEKILRFADESFSVVSRRHIQWTHVDEMMTMFIPHSDYERRLKGGRERDPHSQLHKNTKPISIVVPYSYATYETLMAYFNQTLLESPIFQYSAGGPGDAAQAKLLELVVDAQVQRFSGDLEIHVAYSDSIKYGIGLSTFEWREQWGKKTVTEEKEDYDFLGRPMGVRTERYKEDQLRFEGNAIVPIDPYRFLPDPNVSIHNIQEMEYVGWTSLDSYYHMLENEQNDETAFNIKYVGRDSNMRQTTSQYSPDQSRREYKWGGGDAPKTTSTSYLTNIHMYVTLIPKEWGLPGDEAMNGDGENPEKWLFSVTSDLVLTRAARYNLDHGLYPVCSVAPDYDGYTTTPIGRMEMLHGLQEGLNWMHNSHVANVRKGVNDMLIVDPSQIVMDDLRNPEPGKLIRLRRGAWGRGVGDAVKQLNINDITKNNIGDANFLMDMMQRVSAAVDSAQGIMRSGGERRSATEARVTTKGALSRLEHMAKIISSMYMRKMAYMIASQTQQFMSADVYVPLTEAWQEGLREIYGDEEGIYIKPQDIDIDYGVRVKDGTAPGGASENADLLVQLYQVAASNEAVAGQMDMVKLFQRIAHLMGDKDIHNFVKKTAEQGQGQVMPDQDVQQQVQAGNLVPMPGMGAGPQQ